MCNIYWATGPTDLNHNFFHLQSGQTKLVHWTTDTDRFFAMSRPFPMQYAAGERRQYGTIIIRACLNHFHKWWMIQWLWRQQQLIGQRRHLAYYSMAKLPGYVSVKH